MTGVDQVDTLQDGVNNLAASQLGKGGILQPAGDLASQEGANRAERQGRDDNGSYIPGASGAGNAVAGAADGGKSVASAAASGVKGAGGYLSSALGGGEAKKGQE